MRCCLAFMAVFFIASTAFLHAQGPAYTNGDLTITSDGTVPSNVDAITEITGNLTIGTTRSPFGTLTAFPDFAALEVITGSLVIAGNATPGVTEFTGIFPALDTIHGRINIRNQTVIQTISGFAELDSIGQDIQVTFLNTSLTSLSGFGALKSIEKDVNGHSIRISGSSLTTLPSFDALTRADGNIRIETSGATSLTGFSLLKTVGGDLTISRHGNLTTFPSFDALESVVGKLYRYF